MEYRKLGKTDLMVSSVGFGGIPIQRVSQEETNELISRAQELGVNFVDSARGYTISEELLGNALKGRRDKWYIASKSMARTKEAMEKDIEISLKNLQTDYLDLYQIHNIKDIGTLNQVLEEGGALEALENAKKQGKIRHIGVTAHSLDALKEAVETGKFETIMYPYNIVETQAIEVFKRANELNIGVIAMKPMAGGALDNGELAIKFILQNQNVTTAIPGMATVKELEQNVKASEEYKNFSKEEAGRCEKIANEMGQVFCRRCGYCLPCPQKIDISYCFTLKSYYDNYDLKDWAVGRYDAMAGHAKDCKECGLCESRCPYNLPIREMMKGVKKSFGY